MRTRPMEPSDWPAMHRIFAAGIATGHARFEAEPYDWEHWDSAYRASPRLVIVNDSGTLIGFAAVSDTSPRPVFTGVVELTIYIDPAAQGQGAGLTLLTDLLIAAAAEGIWTVQSNVFPENTASLRLHERAGFRRVGIRERIGLMPHGPLAGQWRDIVVLEHRA